MNQNVKELISAIENDIYSNKYYDNNIHSDFDAKIRLENILRKQKKIWKSETLKYIKRVHKMKELQEEINDEEYEISHRSIEDRKLKEEEERKQSFERFLRKEERQREEIQNKLGKCK